MASITLYDMDTSQSILSCSCDVLLLQDAYDKVIQRLKRGNRFNKIWIEEEKQAQLLPLFVSLATNLLLKDEGYLLHNDTGLESNGFENGYLSQMANIVAATSSHNTSSTHRKCWNQKQADRCFEICKVAWIMIPFGSV